MSYSNWAIALTNFYFNEKSAQKRVRLMLDANLLDHSFSDLGGSEGFIESMRSGPEWLKSEGQELYEICSYLHRQWDNRNKPEGYPDLKNDAPPFLPYLCLFSYAWTIEGFHAGNFTKRLETIFPNHGLKKNQNMKWCTDHLWKGLSEWSAENEGKLGIFKIDRLGSRAHVDISRAQTIFRPAEIELLPDVFKVCGLSPEDSDDINDIHEALVFNKQSWSYRLSSALPPLIINWDTSKDPIAEAALEIIAEELAKWDGETNQQTSRYQPSIKIHRSLKDNNGSLSIDLCVLDDDVAKLSKLELFSDETLVGKFKTEGPRVAILQVANETWDPYLIGKSLNGTAQSHDDDFGDEKHACKWIPRSVSLFQAELGTRIIEADSPPRAGECFCLVSPEGEKAFDTWIKECPSDPSKLIPMNGLKEAWLIYRLSGLEHLDMDSFPLERRASNTRHLIRLTGGTRFSKDSYIDYDLPVLSAVEAGVTFEIIGADLKVIPNLDLTQNCWNSTPSPQYSLEDYDKNGEILISAKLGDYSQDFTITVTHSSELPGDLRRHDSSFHVNQFGWPDTVGLRGCRTTSTPKNLAVHHFHELPKDNGATRLLVDDIKADRFRLWQELCRKPRFNYSELKGRAMHLCSLSEGDFYRAIRLMRDLGDLDICLEENGTISHIYPNPAELAMMPWKDGTKYIAALRGTYTSIAFTQFLDTAKKLGIVTYGIEIGQGLEAVLPPVTYFASPNLDQFEKLCESTHLLEWRNSVACRELAEYSAHIDDWSDTLSERPDRDLYGDTEKIFDTDKFRFKKWDHGNYTQSKFELLLLTVRAGRFRLPPIVNFRKSIKNEDGSWRIETDVTARDPAWAKWYIQYLNTGPSKGEMLYEGEAVDEIPVLYSAEKMQLALPRELSLPYILSRALTLCSGHPPNRISAIDTNYEDIVGNFRGIQNGKGYKGELWIYSGVSKEIAELILSKVEAFPAERQYLDFSHPDEIILSEYY
jgi:hypothetical protein